MTRTTLTLAVILLSGPALASAPQTAPDLVQTRSCDVTLPDPSADDPGASVALRFRTAKPLNGCDGSAPVAFGASVRDSYTGRAR